MQVKQEDQIEELKKQLEMSQQAIKELEETNAHLVTATWRERELKQELQTTKALVEEQNKKILDSINYARRIQQAIIPRNELLDELLGEHFVFYKPKDVVSGDFPWVYELKNHVYVAAVDCTGHGVPGAMMSLIGFLLLNDVVHHEEKVKEPNEVLRELHEGVVRTLKQDDPNNKAADGMDIALVRINKETGEIAYSGAHRPLYHLHNGELTEYKGSKFPIGGNQYGGKNSYENHSFKVNKGDSIYFFSDGLPDQFGGPEKLKYGPKRIRRQITENTDKSMQELNEFFNESFYDWMGDMKQIDDVLLLGIKF